MNAEIVDRLEGSFDRRENTEDLSEVLFAAFQNLSESTKLNETSIRYLGREIDLYRHLLSLVVLEKENISSDLIELISLFCSKEIESAENDSNLTVKLLEELSEEKSVLSATQREFSSDEALQARSERISTIKNSSVGAIIAKKSRESNL